MHVFQQLGHNGGHVPDQVSAAATMETGPVESEGYGI